MKKDSSGQHDPADFSLVLGGPLYRLWLLTRLARPPLDLLGRRIVVTTALLWLPLLVLSLIEGTAMGPGATFLRDLDTQVRFLIAVPILIGAELAIHQRLRAVIKQFTASGLVGPAEQPRFDAAIKSTLRLRDSVMLEVGLLVFVYTVGHWVWRTQIALEHTTWYANVSDTGMQLTAAGWWNAFVSTPLCQFLFLRWGIRFLLWWRLLWKISRINLILSPMHPDRSGGLGFLGLSAYAFQPLLFAQSARLSGVIAGRFLHDGVPVTNFKVEIGVTVAVLVLATLGPVTMFLPALQRTRINGRLSYGLLANRYVQEFEAKWVRNTKWEEPFIGSADVQSLADMANSYNVV